MLEPFQPQFYLRNRHLQTILGDFLPSRFDPIEKGEVYQVEMLDGDVLHCRLHRGSTNRLFLLGHGLTGNAEAPYILRLTSALLKLGHNVCRINYRNCGEGFGFARHPYHSGRSEDLGLIIGKLRSSFPGKEIISIGYSMSGNINLLLAAGVIPSHRIFKPEEFKVFQRLNGLGQADLVISVNPPVDLAHTSIRFLKGLNRLYQWNFIRELRTLIHELTELELIKRDSLRHIQFSSLMKIREFDEQFTSQMGGFSDADEFYRLCSSLSYLDLISAPTKILTSKDDPIIDCQSLLQASRSGSVKVYIQSHGGHMGYLSAQRTPLGDRRWMDYAVLKLAGVVV